MESWGRFQLAQVEAGFLGVRKRSITEEGKQKGKQELRTWEHCNWDDRSVSWGDFFGDRFTERKPMHAVFIPVWAKITVGCGVRRSKGEIQ
jgi:hypothetical protein